MLTSKVDAQPDDLTRVGLDKEWEVRFWSARLSVTSEELRECVLKVGARTSDVEKQLRNARRESFRMGGED